MFLVLTSSRINVMLKARRERWKDCRRDRDKLFFWVKRNESKWKEMDAKSPEAKASKVG